MLIALTVEWREFANDPVMVDLGNSKRLWILKGSYTDRPLVNELRGAECHRLQTDEDANSKLGRLAAPSCLESAIAESEAREFYVF